jgi:hypothetical protein
MRKTLTLWLVLVGMVPALAQKKTKAARPAAAPAAPLKTLSADSYDGWRTIPERRLSPDGRWAGYVINPQEGDGRLVLHGLATPKIDSVPRGYDLRLSPDGQYAVFKIKPQLSVTKDARRAKKKRDELPKDSLGVYAFATGSLTKVPNALAVRVPEKAGRFVAYQLDPGVVKVGAAQKDSLAKAPDPKKPVPPDRCANSRGGGLDAPARCPPDPDGGAPKAAPS